MASVLQSAGAEARFGATWFWWAEATRFGATWFWGAEARFGAMWFWELTVALAGSCNECSRNLLSANCQHLFVIRLIYSQDFSLYSIFV